MIISRSQGSDERRREIGVECSCGFKRRATQINDDGSWNGRAVEGFHWYQIEKEKAADKLQVEGARARGESVEVPVRKHNMTIGLIADMTWSALTGEEHAIGEAYWIGYWQGAGHTRDRVSQVLQKQLDALRTP